MIIAKAPNDTDPLNSPNHNTQHGYIADAINLGWIPVDGTFTYNTANKINVSAGAASIYSVGDKLRFQNNDSGTYLYCYIVNVADTLLTTTGNAVPNATLTDKYYSKIENPQGFPHYFTYTPTLDISGAGTLSSTSITIARFIMKGCWVEMEVDATATISNADASTIYWMVQMPIATTIAAHKFDAWVKDPATDVVFNLGFAIHVHATLANYVLVYRATHAQNAVLLQKSWSNGANREVWVKGTYKVG